jgi:hypothetical protein
MNFAKVCNDTKTVLLTLSHLASRHPAIISRSPGNAITKILTKKAFKGLG